MENDYPVITLCEKFSLSLSHVPSRHGITFTLTDLVTIKGKKKHLVRIEDMVVLVKDAHDIFILESLN